MSKLIPTIGDSVLFEGVIWKVASISNSQYFLISRDDYCKWYTLDEFVFPVPEDDEVDVTANDPIIDYPVEAEEFDAIVTVCKGAVTDVKIVAKGTKSCDGIVIFDDRIHVTGSDGTGIVITNEEFNAFIEELQIAKSLQERLFGGLKEVV